MTKTGRTLKGPELQPTPVRTETGEKLREVFSPRPGHVFINTGYSELEIRLMAELARREEEPLG